MNLTIEAIYENGILKLSQLLPLKENEKVLVTVQTQASPIMQAYGIIGWKGGRETREQGVGYGHPVRLGLYIDETSKSQDMMEIASYWLAVHALPSASLELFSMSTPPSASLLFPLRLPTSEEALHHTSHAQRITR